MAREDAVLQSPDGPYASAPVLIPEVPDFAEEEEDEPSGPDESSDFDQRYREAFTGLVFLGQLTDTITDLGHTFKFSTPSLRERLAAGIIHKKYMNSIAAGMAWTALTVSLYLDSVDGQELPEPLGPDPQVAVEARFNWVLDNIKDKVIDRLFEHVLALDDTVDKVLEELSNVTKTEG